AKRKMADVAARAQTARCVLRRQNSASAGPASRAIAASRAGKRNPAKAAPVRSKNFDIESVSPATSRLANTEPRSAGTGRLRDDHRPANSATPAAVPKMEITA